MTDPYRFVFGSCWAELQIWRFRRETGGLGQEFFQKCVHSNASELSGHILGQPLVANSGKWNVTRLVGTRPSKTKDGESRWFAGT